MLFGIAPFIKNQTLRLDTVCSLIGTMIFSMISYLSFGQDSIQVVRQFENDKPLTKADSFFNSIPNIIFLDLDEGFDDSIRVTVNEQLIFGDI